MTFLLQVKTRDELDHLVVSRIYRTDHTVNGVPLFVREETTIYNPNTEHGRYTRFYAALNITVRKHVKWKCRAGSLSELFAMLGVSRRENYPKDIVNTCRKELAR